MKTEPEKGFLELDQRIKLWLLVFSLATLLILAVAALRENALPDWLAYRRQYARILRQKATDDRGKQVAAQFHIKLEQIFWTVLGEIDRCITCHAGLSDPRMADERQPFATHPGNYLQIHDPNTFGCTVCHGGQGRATETLDAHGLAGFWERPLLEAEHVLTSCTRCHGELETYKTGGLVDQAAGDAGHSGTGLILLGKRLMESNGCLGCHMLEGKGGNLGPDLTRVGDKTHHEFDFSNLPKSDPHESVHWLKRHFLDPASVIPDTVMPNRGFTDRDAEALTAYMLSLRGPATAGFTPAGAGRTTGDESGRDLYLRYCSACHGPSGEGSQVPSITSLTLSNTYAISVSSDSFYRTIIRSGRSGTEMPAWGPGGGNLDADEVEKIIGYMQDWNEPQAELAEIVAAAGDPLIGRAYFQGNCVNCHGADGGGGIGNSLNSPTFLAIASDQFLGQTIIEGRPGTGMPSWRHLPTQAVNDLVAYIRSWQPKAPEFSAVQSALQSGTNNRKVGAVLYRSNCAGCHGPNGEGGIGLALNDATILGAVNDRFLYETIVNGRPSTAMPAWQHMIAADIGAIIAYLRSWQPYSNPAQAVPDYRGEPILGEILYEANCIRCHGENGRGGTGPQLANPVLMASVSDNTLLRWITKGRTGTAMKGFGVGEQGLTSLSPNQIMDVIAWLREQATLPARPVNTTGDGDPLFGEQLFRGSCGSCHGYNGEGLTGPQLRNPYFLQAASDGFLKATMTIGRSGTPMEPMVHSMEGIGQIEPAQTADIIAYLRQGGSEGGPPLQTAATQMSESAISAGRISFAQLCSGCHGPNGRGGQDGKDYFAPALNNPEFLNAASDGFLLATIAYGRSGTPMKPFGNNAGGIASLGETQISEIVSFIRSWHWPETVEEDQNNEETD